MPSFWDMRSDLARRGPKTPAPDPAHGATDKVDGRMPDVLSVSQLTTRVRQAIQARLPGQVVVRGEMWLTVGGSTRHLLPGGTFELSVDVPHAERYGPEGATYWVARRK